MKKIFCLLLGCLFASVVCAQNSELLRVYTDKDCYLAGEYLWVKVCLNDSLLPGNDLSKVAYVEVCDAQQIHAQGKVALNDGVGWARIHCPQTMHSGVYQLTAYTRYMRNYPGACFPKKNIAVLNAVQAATDDAIVAGDSALQVLPAITSGATRQGGLTTDRNRYETRSKVTLTGLDALSGASELTLSVVRSDCKYKLPEALPALPVTAKPTGNYVAECEGHIVVGRLVQGETPLSVRLACVGHEIHLFEGQKQSDNNYLFFTSGVNNQQDIVLSAMDLEKQCRIEPLSPFAEVLPDSLPLLHYWYDEQQMIERSIGAQLQQVMAKDTVKAPSSNLLFKELPAHSYNLDEYVRFNTFRECLVEFVIGIRFDKVKGQTILKTLREDGREYHRSKALVLLDGVPVDDHDALLKYDGRLIHHIHQYRSTYLFGGVTYGGVISITTHRGAFSGMRTDAHAQMFAYEFPQQRPAFSAPRYDTPEEKASRRPDFRHTLCWVPQLPVGTNSLSFYTSDLKGDYVATLQGVLPNGERVECQCLFTVE